MVDFYFNTRLLSKLVFDDEVQGAYGAQYQWPGGRGIDYPKDNPERASSWAAVSQKSEHIDICDASSTGATQQFAAEVEFRKKSTINLIAIFQPSSYQGVMKIISRALLSLFLLTITCHANDGWGTDYQAALTQAAKEKKRVLLDFTGSDWCSWCKRLEKETFSQPEFKTFAAKNLILVIVDFPQGKEQSAAVKNQNEELQAKYHVEGFPTLILLDSKGQIIKQNSGYLSGGPAGFIEWAK